MIHVNFIPPLRAFFLLAVIFLMSIALPVKADNFSDLSVGYRFGGNFREPGVTKPLPGGSADAAQIAKNIANVTYVDSTEHGTDFLLLDLYFSDGADPAKNSRDGAIEPYLIYRHAFRISAWTGSNYGFGPVADTTFVAGVDLNYKNTAYNPDKKLLVAGPEFEIAVPKGYLKAAFLVTDEYDHNGIVGRSEDFNPAWALETSWAWPFTVGAAAASFEGYLNVYGPKGRDDFGHETRTEVLFHPRVIFDLGQAFGRPGIVWGGFGYEYWLNKFGADHHIVPGSIQSTGLLELTAHI